MLAKTIAELQSEGRSPEILFWVGCAGSFDARAQKVTRALCEILNHAGVDFAILGNEERCTGDPARRAGNEFLFQMTAAMNIETLNIYGVKKIVTACPHCFNVLKNEYPALGGNYDVVHHTQLLNELISSGKLKLKEGGVQEMVLEKAADVGGTWLDNTYPRISVDSASGTYVFPSEQLPDWSCVFSASFELIQFFDHC